jgi:hypothetical protein
MGDKNIRKETKKKKKTDSISSVSSSIKPLVPQPEVIKKKKEK